MDGADPSSTATPSTPDGPRVGKSAHDRGEDLGQRRLGRTGRDRADRAGGRAGMVRLPEGQQNITDPPLERQNSGIREIVVKWQPSFEPHWVIAQVAHIARPPSNRFGL